jgi:hypothetical protein
MLGRHHCAAVPRCCCVAVPRCCCVARTYAAVLHLLWWPWLPVRCSPPRDACANGSAPAAACVHVQVQMTAPSSRVYARALAPYAYQPDIMSRRAAAEPLLDFFLHSHSSNATHEEVLLTFVPPLLTTGTWTLSLTHDDDALASFQVAGSPLSISATPAAPQSAALSAPASITAGTSLRAWITVKVLLSPRMHAVHVRLAHHLHA